MTLISWMRNKNRADMAIRNGLWKDFPKYPSCKITNRVLMDRKDGRTESTNDAMEITQVIQEANKRIIDQVTQHKSAPWKDIAALKECCFIYQLIIWQGTDNTKRNSCEPFTILCSSFYQWGTIEGKEQELHLVSVALQTFTIWVSWTKPKNVEQMLLMLKAS